MSNMRSNDLIIEGCNYDAPYVASLSPVEVRIPIKEDIGEVTLGGAKFVLWDNDYQVRLDDCNPGRYNLDGADPSLGWVFETNRSILTRDGRIFIHPHYLDGNVWGNFYLSGLDKVIDASRRIFSGIPQEEIPKIKLM